MSSSIWEANFQVPQVLFQFGYDAVQHIVGVRFRLEVSLPNFLRKNAHADDVLFKPVLDTDH